MVAPAWKSQGTALTGASRSSMALGYPTGLAANDIIIAEIYKESTSTITTVPSGFVAFETVTNSNVGFQVVRLWKRATGTESGTGTFGWSGATWCDGVMHAVSGAITTGTPIETIAQAHQNDNVGNSTPSVSGTTAGTDRLVLWSVHDYWGADFGSQPAGWTHRVHESSFTLFTDDIASASSFGPLTATAVSGSTDELNRAKSVSLVAIIPADATPAAPRETISSTRVGSGAWASGNLNCAPAYPTGVQENDVVFMFVHNKTGAVTTEFGSQVQVPTTPANWERLGTFWNTADAGSFNAGTGRTRCTIFYRVAPSGGLSGTQTVAQAASGTTTAWSIQAAMIAYRPEAGRTNTQFDAVWGGASIGTASTSLSASVGALDIDPADHIAAFAGTRDNTTINSVTPTQTGTTFGTSTAAPGSSVYASGNRQSSGLWAYTPSAASPGTGAVTVTAALATNAETGILALLRTRFTAEVVAAGPEPGRMLLAC